MICPYCKGPLALVTGETIYPRRLDLASKKFLRCMPCDAYVGFHPRGGPLGEPANTELRHLRMRCHEAFDKFWKHVPGLNVRAKTYARLAKEMGIPVTQCHFGEFREDSCRKALEIIARWTPASQPS